VFPDLPVSEDWCVMPPGLIGVYSHSLVQSPTKKNRVHVGVFTFLNAVFSKLFISWVLHTVWCSLANKTTCMLCNI